MRVTVFRILAGLGMALSALGLVLGIRRGDVPGPSEVSIGDLPLIVATVLVYSAISTYAVAGPRAANWLLVRCMKIIAIPERLASKLLGGRLQMPSELSDQGKQRIGGPVEKIDIAAKLSSFSDHWSPRIVAELNGQHVKVVKIQGTFDWHHHEAEDELFLVMSGRLRMDFRDRQTWLEAGEMLVVPRGVEHRPHADDETAILLFEPAGTLNTGNVRTARTVDTPRRI